MSGDLTKADKKRVRQPAGIAWERELRSEILGIAVAINEMETSSLSPFDVNDRIHRFHHGASRDMYKQYSQSLPWAGVCRAYIDRVLTDDDLVDASDEIRDGIGGFAASIARLEAEAAAESEEDGEDRAPLRWVGAMLTRCHFTKFGFRCILRKNLVSI